MIVIPAIDLYKGRAVRLLRGDYGRMTVYPDDPVSLALSFRDAGAEWLHVVDLEGARDGTTANFDTIRRILSVRGVKAEVGGGIRSAGAVEKYAAAGARRVILGTAAVTRPGFAAGMVRLYGDLIAVGVDVRDGKAAVKGWTEVSRRGCLDFCREMAGCGVRTIICTDISKDGVLGGTNPGLYRELAAAVDARIVASGGVSSLGDIQELCSIGLYGAVLGKAIYTGDIKLAEAVASAKEWSVPDDSKADYPLP